MSFIFPFRGAAQPKTLQGAENSAASKPYKSIGGLSPHVSLSFFKKVGILFQQIDETTVGEEKLKLLLLCH
jgi:hypothetical protein